MPAVVQHLAGHVDSLDVASAGEMAHRARHRDAAETDQLRRPRQDRRRAVAAPSRPACWWSSSPRARRAGSPPPARTLGLRPRVAVRVNPDFAVKGSGMRMGGGPQQFGVDVEQAPALLELVGRPRPAARGLPRVRRLAEPPGRRSSSRPSDARWSCVLALADKARPAARRTSTSAAASASRTSTRTSRWTSTGSARTCADLVDDVVLPALPSARVVLELGRFLVGEAGVYVTRVVDRKGSRGTTYLVVDGGHAPPARRVGQPRPGDPAQLPDRRRQPARRRRRRGTADVVGCLCTPLDVLGDDGRAARCRRGRPGGRLPGRRLRPHRQPRPGSWGTLPRPRSWSDHDPGRGEKNDDDGCLTGVARPPRTWSTV